MDTLDVLGRSVQHTHELLATRFDQASAMMRTPGQPRKGFEHVDTFLAVASKHLGAVDAVLLPAVRRSVTDGGQVVHEYLRVARELELALAHVKAREYGSVYQANRSWRSVWTDVEEALAGQRRSECDLVERLAAQLDPGALDEVTERLYRSEVVAPSRPHPYAPHTRLAGLVARKVMHSVDLFWDTVEGRMVPEPVRPAHQRPGLLMQYLLADPRFDEEQT